MSGANPPNKKPRKNCKIPLFKIIHHGLNYPQESGLYWIELNKKFGVNYEIFKPYYQRIGNCDDVYLNSLKNRMTKSKSGFIALDCHVPGCDKVYTHILWTGQPNTVSLQNIIPNDHGFSGYEIQSPTSTPESVVNNTQQLSYLYLQEKNILETLFNSEIIPVTLLKRQPENVWQSYQFRMSHFIKELRDLPNLFMNDFDKSNFGILLSAETGTQPQTDLMPTNALKEFGIRFGSWARIVEKVREFVSDGAKDWFYGKCDGFLATQILSKYPADCEYYIIRSVPVDINSVTDLKYVFAISYRKIGGNITHLRIYKDKMDQLCMINDGEEIQIFLNFKDIIHTVLKNSPTPITNPRFKDLVLPPAEKVTTNDIIHKVDYERLKK